METDRDAANEAEALANFEFVEYDERRRQYRQSIAEREEELDIEAQNVRADYAARRGEELATTALLQAQREQMYEDQYDAENRADQAHAMARKRTVRNAARIAEIDTLDQALAEGYVLESRPHTIMDWGGDKSLVTGPFRVATPVWAIDWDTFGHAGARNVSMDIFRSDDEQFVARVSNSAASYKSFKVFETPGIYYIKVKTKSPVPYHIQIIEFR